MEGEVKEMEWKKEQELKIHQKAYTRVEGPVRGHARTASGTATTTATAAATTTTLKIG